MNASEVRGAVSLDQSWIRIERHSLCERPRLSEEAPPISLCSLELSYLDVCEVKSSHNVKKMVIETEPDKGQVVYFKKCDANYPPILAQIEAAASASVRLSRRENAARIRPVVNEKGFVIGAASYEIQTFRPFSRESLSAEVMLRLGVMDELVARYVRMEDDLHGDQIGITKDGIVGLDYDMMFYSELTAWIKGPRNINNGIVAPLPENLFPITQYDIDHFPDIRDAQPCHWPTKAPNNLALWKQFSNRIEFLRLTKDPMCNASKYFAFLREILIDPAEHMHVIIPNFSRNREGEDMIRKMNVCINKRWKLLEEELVKNTGFRRYLVKNKTVIKEIAEHFKRYNQQIAQEDFQVDLKKLESRFQNLIRRCMVKDLAGVLFDLLCTLKEKEGSFELHSLNYENLVNFCLNFKASKCSFPDAFFTLECQISRMVQDYHKEKVKWSALTQNISKVLDNYRGYVTEENDCMTQSIRTNRSHRDSISSGHSVLNKEMCLAKELQKMLEDDTKHKSTVDAVQSLLDEYTICGLSNVFGAVNPLAYSRSRTKDIEELLKQLKKNPKKRVSLVSNFLRSGSWNTSGYFLGGSANVTLIRLLARRILADFKSQITIEQLLKQDIVELCFAIKSGEWSIETAAESVNTLFQDIVNKKSAAVSKKEPAAEYGFQKITL